METLILSPSRVELLPQLRAGLPTAIIANFLKDTFSLDFDVARFLDMLFEISSRSYEAKPTTQGFLVTEGSETSQQDVLSLLAQHAKHLLPATDGYHTALEVNQKGTPLGLVDLRERLYRAGGGREVSDGNYPEWLERIALLTRRRGRSKQKRKRCLCAIVLTQHGDVLVLGLGALLLSFRAGSWRTYDHTHAYQEIARALRPRGRPRGSLKPIARAIYRTALDVSFRHTGGLIGVLRKQVPSRSYITPHDELSAKGDGLRGVIRPAGFETIERAVRAALAAIDGALVINHEHKLVALGAVVRGNLRRRKGTQAGARTRAAMRLSKGGMAVKISADGDVDLYQGGERTVRLL